MLKKSASKRKEDTRLREIEREKLLKEAALKQARLREGAARHEAELKAKAEEEALKDAKEMERRKKEREDRLVYLKTQAEKLRKKLGSPARALGLYEAIKELSRINDAIRKLEKDFAGEIELQLRPLNDYYGPKIAQAEKVEPRDSMFETEADYNARLNKQEKESASLKAELAAREKQVRDQVHAELSAQRSPLLMQRRQITDQDFPLGAGEVFFRFLTYNPEREEFKVYVDSGQKREEDTTFVADLPVPKESARGFFHNPDLLVPQMALDLREDGSIFLGSAVFHGPEDARYEARNIGHGRMEEVTFKLMSYNSEKEEFRVYIEGKQKVRKGMGFIADLSVPSDKADEFFRKPSLLTPEAVVVREKDGSYTLHHAVFRGHGGEIYEASNGRHGHMEEVTFKLLKYNSEKEEFRVYIEGKQEVKKGMDFIADLTVPRDKADEFFRDPSLLTPEAVVGREKNGLYTLYHAVFRGHGGEIYEVRNGRRGWLEPVTGMEFVWVSGGCFEMGCGSWAGNCDKNEKPVHKVCVCGFLMGVFEVTQGQWRKVMGGNPSRFKKGDDYPVEEVFWNDAQKFIRKLSALNNNKYKFRLPTEAEWEYACRSGGEPEIYSGGSRIDRVAWYDGNSGRRTHRVGTKSPNGLGLYDMSGNVWEWCYDWFGDYPSGHVTDPKGPPAGLYRVRRGGSWCNDATNCRSANRSANRSYGPAGNRSDILGFRLARIF